MKRIQVNIVLRIIPNGDYINYNLHEIIIDILLQ